MSISAWLGSMLIHMALLVVLSLWVVSLAEQEELPALVVHRMEEMPAEEELTVELDDQLAPATELTTAGGDFGDPDGTLGEPIAVPAPEVYKPAPARSKDETAEIRIDDPSLLAPTREVFLSEIPYGVLGQQRAVVDNYEQALDRITQEVLLMLERQRVLLVWCFDQSESMKDDQREIRDRIARVYTELGLSSRTTGGALTNAVTSYGANVLVHTRRPTSDAAKIHEAIGAVPVDRSGKEQMLTAVSQSISTYRKHFGRGRRMLLVLVTDESGDAAENVRYLEDVIAQAKEAQVRVYVLGREAVFGYPHAYMRWRHPQTRHVHWLQIDRGPETSFVEQLQTDGFHRRYDSHPSGYGPYDQSRLAVETGGIFFLLPSVETNLVRGEKRRYELEAMRYYKPDLGRRTDYLRRRAASPLQMHLWKVITDLNPYNEKAAEVIVMRVTFSLDPRTFVRQVRREQLKAKTYLVYLDRAIKALEEIKHLRAEERSDRWAANYDLVLAQLYTFVARVYEYGAYLEAFVQNPKIVPAMRPPNLRLVHWDVHVRRETMTGATIEPYVKRATELLEAIQRDHPGTPWAARAQWELRRGFGVELVPDYHAPTPNFSGPLKPIPKL